MPSTKPGVGQTVPTSKQREVPGSALAQRASPPVPVVENAQLAAADFQAAADYVNASIDMVEKLLQGLPAKASAGVDGLPDEHDLFFHFAFEKFNNEWRITYRSAFRGPVDEELCFTNDKVNLLVHAPADVKIESASVLSELVRAVAGTLRERTERLREAGEALKAIIPPATLKVLEAEELIEEAPF